MIYLITNRKTRAKTMKKIDIKSFLKNEIVTVISFGLAVISLFIVPIDGQYLEYIDFRTLAILLSLMLVVAGFRKLGVFKSIGSWLLTKSKNARELVLVFVLLCFCFSMLITNDVALITFVPFALALLEGAGLKHRVIYIVVLQTIAANLGSMLTPIGNPQNLYLYTLSGMQIGEFLCAMFPFTLISLVTLILLVTFGKKNEIVVCFEKAAMPVHKKKLAMLIILFLLCMGTVIRVVDWRVSFAIVLVAGLLFFRNLFREVDYYLLGTFCGFFLFIGNMK